MNRPDRLNAFNAEMGTGLRQAMEKAARDAEVRVLRDNVVIYTGRISSLRRFKDDVNEVRQGYECGAGVSNFADIKVGDVVSGPGEVKGAHFVAKELTAMTPGAGRRRPADADGAAAADNGSPTSAPPDPETV